MSKSKTLFNDLLGEFNLWGESASATQAVGTYAPSSTSIGHDVAITTVGEVSTSSIEVDSSCVKAESHF